LLLLLLLLRFNGFFVAPINPSYSNGFSLVCSQQLLYIPLDATATLYTAGCNSFTINKFTPGLGGLVIRSAAAMASL